MSISQAGSRVLLLLFSQGATLLLLLQLSKVMCRLRKGWLLLTDWRCSGLFLEHHHQHTPLPLWTNEFYLSGCVSRGAVPGQRRLTWGNILCPEIDLHALQPSLRPTLFSCVGLHLSVCTWVLANKQSGVRKGLVWCHQVKHKKFIIETQESQGNFHVA